jgi:hypothetical protein
MPNGSMYGSQWASTFSSGQALPILEENRKLLNRQMRDFQRTGQWTHPFAIGIRFIDLMVSAALVQGVQWHMWLWYFNNFTEMLVDNLDIQAPDMEPDAEWPTIGYYLIYEMFNVMTDWIRLIEHLPADQPNIVMKDTRFSHENGNIPKSAIMVLALCFRRVVLSENVLPRFKRYIRDILLRLLQDLNGRPKLTPYEGMLVNALAVGDFGGSRKAAEYQVAFRDLLEGADISVRQEAETLKAAINELVRA